MRRCAYLSGGAYVRLSFFLDFFQESQQDGQPIVLRWGLHAVIIPGISVNASTLLWTWRSRGRIEFEALKTRSEPVQKNSCRV